MISTLRSAWQSLSLSKQFAIVAIAVLVPGMAVTGWWIAQKIGAAVIRNTASATAISMDGLLGPFAGELALGIPFSVESQRKLDALLGQARENRTVVSMKIWRMDGTIMYSTFPDMIGKRFEPSHLFAAALSGEVSASFGWDAHEEDANERLQGVPLLEVYAPLRDPVSRKIVAVSEFYANGEQLDRDMRSAVAESWLFVCAIAGLMIALLSGIAVKGGQTIALQQEQLRTQVGELKELLQANQGLQERLRIANENVSSINEMVLQNVGADLHDGPAQRLSYAAMRLSELRRKAKVARGANSIVDDLHKILSDTLNDIRRMSGGLALPELKECSLEEAAELAVKTHEDYTGTNVTREFTTGGNLGSLAQRNCVYRLVQEGLANAYKHASGKSQKVILLHDGATISLTIADHGPGISKLPRASVKGLGLRGMQARVDALGGVLTVQLGQSGGTEVTAVLPASEGRYGDGKTDDQGGVG